MHHVCLVSDQPIPNFLPMLQPELKPIEVTLVVSEKMRNKATWLRKIIEAHQVHVTQDLSLGDISDINKMEDVFLCWLDTQKDKDGIALNVTGGNKPMAIAAQEAFRAAGLAVFYVDIATDLVSWVEPNAAPIQLSENLSVENVMSLNGFSITSSQFCSRVENVKWQALSTTLARDVKKWGPALGRLNGYATKAEERHSLDCGNVEENVLYWEELLSELYGNELIRDNHSLYFSSEAARRFCNGAWLEHLVFCAIKRLGFDKKAARMNVCIEDGSKNRNELDAVVVSHNMLYVIECKTKNMKFGDAASDAVYKLADLVRIGGLRARGILVSYRSLRDEDKRRAKIYGITVIDNLARLDELLEAAFR